MPEQINRTSLSLPPEVSGEILQKTQEQSAVMQLARQITLPGNGVTIPVITGDPTAGWVGETDPKPVSKAQLGTKIMRGYKLAVIEPFSNEFRRDAKALYDALISRLPNVLGATFDQTVAGTIDKPGDDFDNLAGCVKKSITNEDNGTYLGLVAADTEISTHGGLLNGYAFSAQGRALLLTATDGTGRPIFLASANDGTVSKVLGVPTFFNRGLYKAGTPSVVGAAGDWTKAVYGTVEGVKIDVSDQATLQYQADGETVTLNLWQRNMFAVRAEIEIGFRADTSCFVLLTGANAA